MKNDISNNIKKVLFIFLMCFIGLIGYISHFYLVTAPKIVNSPLNMRSWAKRNEVLRGTIYDRNSKALTISKRVNTLTQDRQYTSGPAFCHVLGYVNQKYGLTGIEKKYDSYLMADNESQDAIDLIKKIIANPFQKNVAEEKIGDSLYTTLDYNLQNEAYNLLNGKKGAVVAVNPKTGEVLALVSSPSYDPNNLDSIWSSINTDNNRPLINRAVSGLYPPGSTFKMITAMSSIENISDIMQESFNDTGKLYLNSKQSISDFDGEAPGHLDFKSAFVQSSNVVFGTLAMKLGNSKLKSTAEKFYFNNNIPSDDISISKSIFPAYKSYEIGNIAQSGFGQAGVVATPIQMTMVASTIANGGVMMKPYIVNKIVDKKGNLVKQIQPQEVGTIINSNEANTMKDFMRSVVESGTGMAANIDGLNVCGKTGTAEHDYSAKGSPTHSWFVGFAPKESASIAVGVIVEDGGTGGGIAAQIAAQIIKTYLKG